VVVWAYKEDRMNKLEKIRKIVEKVEIGPHQGDLAHALAQAIMKIKRILGTPPKLFALIHDGTLDGDSTFYAGAEKIEYKLGQNIHEIIKNFLNAEVAKRCKDLEAEEPVGPLDPVETRLIVDEVTDQYKDAKGAWIVDEETILAIEALWDAADPSNDSASYAANRAAKGMAHRLAFKRLGRKIK
jgi:hypothetical protein